MTRYLKILLILSVLVSIALAALTFYYKFTLRGASYFNALEEYQFHKIESATDINTVFIGDSSLGNSIDTKLFDKTLGTRSISLALTGVYGYIGSYNMLRLIGQRNNIKNVIIVHTLDILKRKVDYRAHLLTSETLLDKHLSTAININIVTAAIKEMLDIKYAFLALKHIFIKNKIKKAEWESCITHDYYPQDNSLKYIYKAEHFYDVTLNRNVRNSKIDIMQSMIAYCNEKKYNCVYAFGPLYEHTLENSRLMLRRSREAIHRTGLRIIPGTPVPLTYDQLGDQLDHVGYAYKEATTLRYAALLKDYLK